MDLVEGRHGGCRCAARMLSRCGERDIDGLDLCGSVEVDADELREGRRRSRRGRRGAGTRAGEDEDVVGARQRVQGRWQGKLDLAEAKDGRVGLLSSGDEGRRRRVREVSPVSQLTRWL